MKFLLAFLVAAFTVSAFADVTTCSGTKDGRMVVFTITKDASLVKAISVSVDGEKVGQKLTEVRANELAGGVMITASQPWAIAINDVSIFVDEKRNCFEDGSDGCYLGWVSLYQENLVIRGIELKCE